MGARRIGGLVYVAVQWSGCAHALVGAIATAVVLVDGNHRGMFWLLCERWVV